MNFLRCEISLNRLESFFLLSGVGPEIKIKLGIQKNLKNNIFFITEFMGCKNVQMLFL